jgi:hypothetical protein
MRHALEILIGAESYLFFKPDREAFEIVAAALKEVKNERRNIPANKKANKNEQIQFGRNCEEFR